MERNQIRIGSVLSYIQLFASVIIGILYTPVMIRLLGKSEYGLYNIVSSVISILSILNLGFNAGYIRYYSKYKKEDDQVSISKLNGLFLIMFTIIGVIALACGTFLMNHLTLVFDEGLTLHEYKIAKVLMLLLTINLAVSFPMGVFANIISANERFIFLKGIGIIRTVLGPLVTLPLLLMGYRSIAMVAVTLSINLAVDGIYLLYVLFILKNKFVFHSFEKGLFRNLFVYTFFIALHLIVDQVNWNIAKVLLGRFQGTEQVSIYSVGYSLYSYYMMLGLPVATMFTPRIHSMVETENDPAKQKEKLTGIFVKVGNLQYLILAMIFTGLIFFGQPFIKYWAGASYDEAYYVALLLVLAGTPDLIQNVGIEIQRAQNKHKFRAWICLAMAIINIGISIFLCQWYGAIGAAVGTALSLVLVQGLIINIYLHKKCNLNVLAYWKSILRKSVGLIIPVVVGVVMMLFIKNPSLLVLLAEIIAYAMIYCVSMWFLGMSKDEKDVVKQMLSKIFKKRKNIEKIEN